MKKTLTVILALVLVVALSVAGTMAYMTSTTEEVKNTFSVGNVGITLDEAKVDPKTGKAIDDGVTRSQGNDYRLYPGMTYDKDPTVHVDPESEDCYIRIFATVTCPDADTLTKLQNLIGRTHLEGAEGEEGIIRGYDASVWNRFGEPVVEGNTVKYEFRYKYNAATDTGVWTKGDPVDLPLFKEIAIPSEWTGDDVALLNGLNLDLIAEAIQAEGFENATAAWDHFPDAPAVPQA